MANSNVLHKFSTPKEFLSRNPMSISKFEGEIRRGTLIVSYMGMKRVIRDDHEAAYQQAIRSSADAPDEGAEWRRWRASKGGKAAVKAKAKARAEAEASAKPVSKAARHRVIA